MAKTDPAPSPDPDDSAQANDSAAQPETQPQTPTVAPGTQAVVEAVEALPDRLVDALRTASADAAAQRSADSAGADESGTEQPAAEETKYEVLVDRVVRRDSAPDKPFDYTRFLKGRKDLTFPAEHQAADRDRLLKIGAIKPVGEKPQGQLRPDPPTLNASGFAAVSPEREAAVQIGTARRLGATSDNSANDQPAPPGEDA